MAAYRGLVDPITLQVLGDRQLTDEPAAIPVGRDQPNPACQQPGGRLVGDVYLGRSRRAPGLLAQPE